MSRGSGNDASSGDGQKGRSVAAGAINFHYIAPIVIAGLGLIVFLDWAQDVLLPLVAGIMISYALDPVVSFLDRIMPRPISAAIVLTSLLAILALAAVPLQNEAVKMLERVPAAVHQFEIEQIREPESEESLMEKAQEAAKEIEESAEKSEDEENGREPATAVRIVDEPFSLRDFLMKRLSGGTVLITQLFSVLFLVYFVLATGSLYKRKIVRLSGPDFHGMRKAARMLSEFHSQMRRFIFVMFLGALFVGVLTWLAFLALGVEQSLLWGVLSGVASAIPYLGPFLVFVGSGGAAFIQFGSMDMALAVAGASLVITSIQGYLLTPWLTSHVSSLNAVVIFIGLLFWGWLWGPVGLILATPLLMMTKTLCDHVENLQGVGELLGK